MTFTADRTCRNNIQSSNRSRQNHSTNEITCIVLIAQNQLPVEQSCL